VLDGLLVADFSRVLAGPYATMLLGDLGADVVKVERPGTGDDTRGWGPPWSGDDATYYLGLNRNKRSVVLDLADPGDRELARELALRADVLVESFRPGLMAGWGLDGDTLRASGNPKLVSCSVTAFGSGEGATLPGYDFLAQAVGGVMHITGAEDGPPTKVGAAVVDLICGLLSAIGILAALQGGGGRHVETSLMDAALTALLNQGSAWVLGGSSPGRMGNRHPSIVPYQTFATADRDIAIAVGNDRLFARLWDAVGLEADPRYATSAQRVEHRDELTSRLGAVLRTAPADHWIALCRERGVPAGPVNDVPAAWALAESLGLQPLQDGFPAPPLRVDGERPRVSRLPPALDEHGDEIRRWLRERSAPGGSSSAA
jgi:crotonobetainyl-CoA:carnitine CoA-transferase CaiB-like acyl-CoA transferase